jgi:hypothetical protein
MLLSTGALATDFQLSAPFAPAALATEIDTPAAAATSTAVAARLLRPCMAPSTAQG